MTKTIRVAVRAAIVVAGLASLGACASIPQRAWRKREAMAQYAYQSVMSGNHRIRRITS